MATLQHSKFGTSAVTVLYGVKPKTVKQSMDMNSKTFRNCDRVKSNYIYV